MILHLITDDKFTNYIIQQFKNKEMLSDFILLISNQEIKYFEYIEDIRIVNPNNEVDMEYLLEFITHYKSVVFHGLFYPWQEWLLKRWPSNVKIAWVCWGGEIYGQPDIYTSFLKPLTKCIYFLRRIYKYNKIKQFVFPKELLYLVNYCLTNVDEEYEFVKKYLKTDIKLINYAYYNIEETLGPLKNLLSNGRNIFVGNSATIENNHIETFLQLKKLDLDRRKIIVPLSYGEPWVRNLCVKIGKRLFKDKFCPLLDFISRDSYNSMMLDCSIMIQSHLRENAHGNIITGIWLGMKIYLSEKGMYYKRFKRIGCYVFSIENELIPSNPTALTPLSKNEVEHNRRILLSIYGRDVLENNIHKLVNTLS